VREAIGTPATVDIPRGYHRAGSAGVAPVERFVERVGDYHAGVRRVAAADTAAAVADALSTGLPAGSRP
jgi:hypothetical protein